MKNFFLALLAFCLLASIGLNYILSQPHKTAITKTQKDVASKNDFPFLSPVIFTENSDDILIHFIDLRTKLRKYADTVPDTFGVYFEYLPTGSSVGVNSNTEFVLASLLKVPLSMAIYKKIEDGTITLNTQLTIQEEDLDKLFGSLWKRGANRTLSVKEALQLMLANSDNTAKNVLAHNLTDEDIMDVFDGLDIPVDIKSNKAEVSPRNYSSVLRSLYLSSYLSKQDSNEILQTLASSNFTNKIAQPIPDNIPVAHKIGVYDDQHTPETPIYSDCGIIYIPNRPYILCIMADTTDANAQKYMQAVSKIVYDYVRMANR